MTQDELKQAVARAARDYVADRLPTGAILGVGTGSTANFFIDEIAAIKDRLGGAVASSEATAQRLRGHGIGVNVHYIPIHTQPDYQSLGFAWGMFPNAEKFYSQIISLPLYAGLTDEDLSTVVSAVKASLAG